MQVVATKTHTTKTSVLEERIYLVKPVKITLGHHDEGETRHLHFVPILEILKAIHGSVKHQILNPFHAGESML